MHISNGSRLFTTRAGSSWRNHFVDENTMRLDEIRIDWSGLKDHIAAREAEGRLYDVVVANPRLGSYAEAKNLPYKEARNRMVELAQDHFSSIFRDDPAGIRQEYQNYDAIKVAWETTGTTTFYFLRDVTDKR